MPRVRRYEYVGPPEIREAALTSPRGVSIEDVDDVAAWLAGHSADAAADRTITATFVIDCEGVLRLAPRRSEHIACAGGGTVFSAGEIAFSSPENVVAISNQSTGYCPEPESWPHVATALDRIPVAHPSSFTTAIVFRLCEKCNERCIVKDDWFICEMCGADLPLKWNFASS